MAQSALQPYVMVLGTTQDGGYPHIGCERECCKKVYDNKIKPGKTTALALVDPASKKWWLFEAGPDLASQLHFFADTTGNQYPFLPEGIFITHAHIGHYAGLMFLGREALGAKETKVFALPRLKNFLEQNGPWSQLVSLKNIVVTPLENKQPLTLNQHIKIIPFTVPHRDEYSETAGFEIQTSHKKYLFIPDIDKWSKFNTNIRSLVMSVDNSFLDASFYSMDEMKHRNLEEIPHPLVIETMEIFKDDSAEIKSKIRFIHFNHTNRLLWDEESIRMLNKKGFNVSKIGDSY